ncbi:MAG: hypothetical protein V1244_01585 [Nitrospinaceae bacterium]|jgi:hypothetical protein|nr:hypothetical protein [Nitrospinaceae bacterium]
MKTEEPMNVSVEERLSPEEEPSTMSSAERTVRAMVELVLPLVISGSKPTLLDIFEDIALPTQQLRWNEQLEIERLCEIFTFVLEQVGNSILTTLASYFPALESEHTLKHFVSAMEHLADSLSSAYDTSLIEAFRIGLLKGFDDEPF